MSYVVSGHRCWREEKSFGWRRNRCRGLCCEHFVAKVGAGVGRKNRGAAIAVFVWDERAALRLIPRGFLFELMEFWFLSSTLSFSPCLSFFFLFISYSFVHSQMCTRMHTVSRFHCLPQETKHRAPVEWWWWPPSDCKGVIIDEYPLADVDRWHILGLAVNETVLCFVVQGILGVYFSRGSWSDIAQFAACYRKCLLVKTLKDVASQTVCLFAGLHVQIRAITCFSTLDEN